MEFTPKEIELLIYFTINKNKVLSREQILNKVWGYDYFGDTRAVDNLIKRMRKNYLKRIWDLKSNLFMGWATKWRLPHEKSNFQQKSDISGHPLLFHFRTTWRNLDY